jgi:hypothetical protein
MSELAFNANGENFELPPSVTSWRVRRMKPRGAPELVYGTDGRPLTLPVDATIDELRDAVGSAGKYRLDPINDEGKFVDSVPAAYVQVTRQARNVEPTSVTIASSATSDDTLREAMRLNTELARSIVDKFPEMMHAAAELLRAADGAGLPARQPRERDEDDYEDDEEEIEDVARAPGLGIDINALVAQVVPMLVMAFANGDKSKLPSLSEMLDWRKAVPKAKELSVAPIDVASTDAKPSASNGDVMERVGAVLAELTPEERMLAISLAQELSPDERAAWFAELAPMSVGDAVARLRKVLSGKKERVS